MCLAMNADKLKPEKDVPQHQTEILREDKVEVEELI
jgi:hypothetical protein